MVTMLYNGGCFSTTGGSSASQANGVGILVDAFFMHCLIHVY